MTGMSVPFAVVATAAFFFASPSARADTAALPSPRVTAVVDDVVARYGLPGIAVGIVADGEVRQVELRGEAVLGGGGPVAGDTRFKVASNTKAMTAALLARQVDAGLLAWDDPVVKHLPGFRMYEEWVTREIQVRDLLIHNSGLGPGAGDLMLWPEPNAFTRDEVIAGLAHLRPLWSFRSRYAYDNTLYIVAGEVAAAVGGAPFDELLRREVFAPLGMDDCRIGEWQTARARSIAAAHVRRDGTWIARRDGEVVADMPMAAAGGVRCGLDDMLRWVRAWLEPGTVHAGRGDDARPWLSSRQREAAWTAHMPMPLSQRMRDWNRSHYSAYGYGWRLSDVDGTAKVAHTGTLSGMYSAVTLLPELDVGYVILIHADAGEARTVLEQSLGKIFTACGGADPSAGLPCASEPGLVTHYAGLLADERAATAARAASHAAEDGSMRIDPARQAASAAELAPWLGH